ncbi:MAG TPA: hypothetical protein VFF79_10110 [Conexibacter sp.]|jgi:hypothetical protein|nr:hypothetical protein [Conexibacter sp.]
MEAAFGIVGEPPGGQQSRSGSRRRRLAPLGVFTGVAGFAAGLTCVYLAMRDLMVSKGGACASGGPYQVAAGHQCGGEAGLMIGGIVALLAFGAVFAGSTGAGGGPGSGMDAGFLMWAALFGVLGVNFLTLGFDPPAGQSGAGGWIASGIVFELIALGGIVPLVWSARELLARGGAPEAPLFRGPLVRAKVNEGLVYDGVPGIAYTARRADGSEVPPPGGARGPDGAHPAAPPPEPPSAPLPKRLTIPRRDWRSP